MSIVSTTISNTSTPAGDAPIVENQNTVEKQSIIENQSIVENQAAVENQAIVEKQTGFGSDLVEIFLVEAWEGLQQFENATLRLREGMDEATLQDIVMFGHRLRGSSGLYGYPQISQLCDMVERLAQAAPALDSSQHKLVREFFDHVMVCFRGSLERIANGKTEGNIGLELAHLGGSNLLLSLLKNAQLNSKNNAISQKQVSTETVAKTAVQTDFQVKTIVEQDTLAISTLLDELELYRNNEQETLEYFLPEVKENLEIIDQGFYELSQAGSDVIDPEIINQLFRAAHTLKGSSYMVELQFLGDVGHALEDIMIKVREEGMHFAEAEPVLRKGTKSVKALVSILEGKQAENLGQELDTNLQDFQRSLDDLLGLGAVDIVTLYEVSADSEVSTDSVVQEKAPVEHKAESVSILLGELELYRNNEQETLEYFLPEVKEHLEHIDQGFYELSQADKTSDTVDPEIINQLFRAAHTLKGSAYMVELHFLGDIGHALEDIMIKVREDGLDFAKAEPVLRKGNKAVKEIVAILEGTQANDYEQQLNKSLQDFQRALDHLLGLGAVIIYDDILQDKEASGISEGASQQFQLERGFQQALDALLGYTTDPDEQVLAQTAGKPAQASVLQQKAKPVVTIRASVQRLDDMLNLVGDLLGSRTRLQNRLDTFSTLTKQLETSRLRMQSVTKEFEKHYLNPQLASSQAQSASDMPDNLNANVNGQFVPANHLTGNDKAKHDVENQALHKTLNERFAELEFDSYSDINILAGSIAEMANDLTEMQYQFDSLGFELSRDASEIHSISQSLRSQIGRVRMVAMTHLFSRLDRLLKHGQQDDEQDIFFETIGEQVEIDNAILEAVFDPIVQLVKNSKTHGIESRSERLAKGKPAQGRITVQASYQRNSVIITIKDDGKGIDLEAVKAKAIERELITVPEAAALSDDEARQLIFSPGLSTAETLTSEAGRGVGMDIVASRIRSVKGSVQVDSQKDVGTTFMLYLPLTLLISDILLVGAAQERFAVPTESIRAIERLSKDIMQWGMAGGQQEQPTVVFNEMTIPVFHLAELLGMAITPLTSKMHADSLTSQGDKQLMLILETAGKHYALLLDSIFDIEEVIIKSLSKRLEPLDFILGATMSSYGDVVLLLDPQGLYQLGQEYNSPQRSKHSTVHELGNSQMETQGINSRSAQIIEGQVPQQVNQQINNDKHNVQDSFIAQQEIPEIVEKSVKRLLLVDDSVSVRKVLGKKLERMGYEVTTAYDGQDAFDILLRDDNFDALLSDLEMPRMNGYELIDAVRHRSNQTQKLPIIVMSTRARKEHVDLAKELGADDYLVKPVDEATLAQRLEQYI